MLTRSQRRKMEAKIKVLMSELNSAIRGLNMCKSGITAATGDVSAFEPELERLRTKYDNAHKQLSSMALESDSTVDFDKIEELQQQFEELYFPSLSSVLSKKNPPEIKPDTSTSKSVPFKIPSLKLPQFSGNFADWANFKALFVACIHDNPSFSDIQRLQFLRTYCTDSALALIQNLPIADESYAKAWEILTSRYDNNRSVANHFYSQMFNFKPDSNPQETLKNFSAVFRSSIAALENLPIDLSDFLLLQLGLHALSPDVRGKFEDRVREKDFPRLDDLLQFVDSLQRSHETLISEQPSTSTTVTTLSRSCESSTSKPKKAFIVHTDPPKSEILCTFCGSDAHRIFKCTDFLLLSITQRHDAIKRLHRCLSCFGNHHISKCKSTKRCTACNSKYHNSLLHPIPSGDIPPIEHKKFESAAKEQ